MQPRTLGLLTKGAIGGLIAGAVIAVQFLVIDLLAGDPFATPMALAGAFFGSAASTASFGLVVGYSLLHFGVFAALGAATAVGLDAFGMEPRLRYGLVFGMGVLNAIHYGALLASQTLQVLAAVHVLVANLLGGMALMIYLHRAERVEAPLGAAALRDHPMLSKGIGVGLAGALAVAVWFLVLDIAGGRPFFTPAALGSMIFLGARGADAVQVNPGIVAGYTTLHVVAFLMVGVGMVWLSERLEQQPGLWLGVLMGLIVCKAGFLGGAGLFGGWLLGALGWWAIGAGNVLAVGVMGWIVWQSHPLLRKRLMEEPVATMT